MLESQSAERPEANAGFVDMLGKWQAVRAPGSEGGDTPLQRDQYLFPNFQVYLFMYDVAIKATNAIARRAGEEGVIPAGSTYKIRKGEFFFRGKRALPSYLQAGSGFFVEKSKRRMIGGDIRTALALLA